MAATAVCPAPLAGAHPAPVRQPVFVRNMATGETGWFSSPAFVDLPGMGPGAHKRALVAPLSSTYVFDPSGGTLGKGTATHGRIYAPSVVADLDRDGTPEVVVGGDQGTVVAYELGPSGLTVKAGWPASTCSAGQCPEVRGMAAGDLDGDGQIEVVVTTTQTQPGGAQVFAFSPDGRLFQPAATPFAAWPRYNTASGPGGDADFEGQGNHGYGCYGENVGIGNLDDDPALEIVVTYDNHEVNVFKADGTSMLASSFYTNPLSPYSGQRMGWGQFIRWLDPMVEEAHYHLHTGAWPDIATTMWLQWTASPPNVVDLDGDGKNEVVGIPNAEEHEPYETQGYAFVALGGSYGDGSGAGRRLAAFERPFLSGKPAPRAVGDDYPPSGIPAPTTANILGDTRPEIIAPVNDGYVYALGPDGELLWKFDYARGDAHTFASEAVIADLNQDGVPEVLFGVYALGANAGRLVVLENTGALLWDVRLPGQGQDGNGIGVAAAPTVGDLDGDGTLEIAVLTFDHGLDLFTVPGSAENCLPWPTARGSNLRAGTRQAR